MPLDNPGENIDKAADGYTKFVAAVRSSPIITAVIMIIASSVIDIWLAVHFSNMSSNSKDEQRKEDNAYWQPQVIRLSNNYDSVVRIHARDSITIELYKQEFKMINKKVDSLKNN